MALATDLTAHRLQAVLARAQVAGRIPSVAAALTRDRSLVWRGWHGDTTGSAHERPSDLSFRIGSISKTFTAVLVMQLRDAGALRLDDPLSAYLKVDVLGDRTLRSLLAHHGGLAAEPTGQWWERVDGGDLRGLLSGLEVAPPFGPGEVFHYSNVGYGLLGAVVAELRGTSWWECVSERILTPLGMSRTTYDPFEPHARGYSVNPYAGTLSAEPLTDTGAMAPAGQMWSTVFDLATYADFLVEGADDVLATATLEEMCTPQTGTAETGLSSGYGLGLRLIPGPWGTLVGHTGSMPGFQAALFVDRARREGAVVLANSTVGLVTDQVGVDLLTELDRCEPAVPDAWRPAESVPDQVRDVLGVWHWGNTAHVFSWDGRQLVSTFLDPSRERDRYELLEGRLLGVSGYHLGEELLVHRHGDGTVSHLECATFIYTRTPYEESAPIPGGAPTRP